MSAAPVTDAVQTTRALVHVLCPLGFVHGYRCAGCGWALLFPDCHVTWSIPFCYQVHAQKAFTGHRCGESTETREESSCHLCCDLYSRSGTKK